MFFVTIHGRLKLEIRASVKPDIRFGGIAFRLVSILRRRNPYGMHSHAGAVRTRNVQTVNYFLNLLKDARESISYYPEYRAINLLPLTFKPVNGYCFSNGQPQGVAPAYYKYSSPETKFQP